MVDSRRLDGPSGMILRGWIRAEGFGERAANARPVIGICSTWSELNPCNAGLRDLGRAVARGVSAAGGLPLEFPVLSLGENFLSPTAMLLRNLMSMDVEEMITRSPIDGVVLLGGCDKTIPALLMGAASAGKPAVVVASGPRTEGRWRGGPLVTDDYWTLAAQRRSGQIGDSEWAKLETSLNPSVGTCNVMGTAATMALSAEVLGMAPPGSAFIPAVDGRRTDAAELAGEIAVTATRDGRTPASIMTPAAFENAIRAVIAIAGSTNAILHLIAVAGRLGVELSLDRVAEIARTTPLIANVRPTGSHLLSALDDAGGAPALLRILSEELDLDAVSVTGETLRQIVERAPGPDGEVLRPLSNPVAPQSGVRILHGSLAPGGAVLKVAGADPALRKHTGPAIVFNGSADLLARIHDPALGATADSVLVLRNAGPVGGPGMPEAGGIPIPEPLFAAGVRDIIRLSDARMSGTQAGSMILHVTPEAAVGGPLALVQDGDLIALDADAGTLDLLVDPEVLAARAPAAKPEAATRGYEALYVKHVLQADQGCDFDFLVGSGGSGRTTEVTSEHG